MKKSAEYNFMAISLLATRTEKAKEYEDAANLWRKASLLAKNPHNIEWAMHRKNFCTKRIK